MNVSRRKLKVLLFVNFNLVAFLRIFRYSTNLISIYSLISDDSLFPDDSLTLVSLGNVPVLVQKQTKPGENDADSSSSSDEDDNKSVIRSYNEVGYENIFAAPIKFHSYDRKIFIPGVQVSRIYEKVIDLCVI